MLTLLRVRHLARLRRRSKLDGASRPLHRAGLLAAFIFCECRLTTRDGRHGQFQGNAQEPPRPARWLTETTNLGVRSSNLFGRAT
jgi:hypothetical protein